MADKSPAITMESLRYHQHYDANGQPVAHDVGAIYELHDGQGMTAEQLANSFTALGVARRSEGKKKAPPPEPPAKAKR